MAGAGSSIHRSVEPVVVGSSGDSGSWDTRVSREEKGQGRGFNVKLLGLSVRI